jgi:hypothetical protein
VDILSNNWTPRHCQPSSSVRNHEGLYTVCVNLSVAAFSGNWSGYSTILFILCPILLNLG